MSETQPTLNTMVTSWPMSVILEGDTVTYTRIVDEPNIQDIISPDSLFGLSPLRRKMITLNVKCMDILLRNQGFVTLYTEAISKVGRSTLERKVLDFLEKQYQVLSKNAATNMERTRFQLASSLSWWMISLPTNAISDSPTRTSRRFGAGRSLLLKLNDAGKPSLPGASELVELMNANIPLTIEELKLFLFLAEADVSDTKSWASIDVENSLTVEEIKIFKLLKALNSLFYGTTRNWLEFRPSSTTPSASKPSQRDFGGSSPEKSRPISPSSPGSDNSRGKQVSRRDRPDVGGSIYFSPQFFAFMQPAPSSLWGRKKPFPIKFEFEYVGEAMNQETEELNEADESQVSPQVHQSERIQSRKGDLVSTTAQSSTRAFRSKLWPVIRNRLTAIFSPPPRGCQRITYICGCGELVYLDVRELSPGGIDRLRDRLLRSAANGSARQHASALVQLTCPPQAHLGSGNNLSNNTGAASSTIGGRRQLWPLLHSQGGQTMTNQSTRTPEPQFLLICVNIKRLTTLVQLEVNPSFGDSYLFQEIWRAYKQVREENEWSISRAAPLWIRYWFYRLSKRCPMIPSLSKLQNTFAELKLYKVGSADFVRFQLVPVGNKCCPLWFKRKDFPPASEVSAGRYIYEPVPMDDVEFVHVPLAHLLKPGEHLDEFWINTCPRKLSEELRRPPGATQRVIGRGIRMNETMNWVAILVLLGILLAISAIVVVIFAVVTKDNSSAFGLGAFLIAMLTIYSTYQYLSWNEDA